MYEISQQTLTHITACIHFMDVFQLTVPTLLLNQQFANLTNNSQFQQVKEKRGFVSADSVQCAVICQQMWGVHLQTLSN